jgi:hypothetical protein
MHSYGKKSHSYGILSFFIAKTTNFNSSALQYFNFITRCLIYSSTPDHLTNAVKFMSPLKKLILIVFFFAASLLSFSQVNLNQGLMAYYPFNGSTNDVSGNNNNPSFNNATLTSDRFGNPSSAYHFNGTNNYMQIPNAPTLNFTNKMTIVTWVRVTGFYQGTCHGNRIVMKGEDGSPSGNYVLTFDDNAFTNGQHCFNPVPDIAHQNFHTVNTIQPPGGYTPYIQTNQWYSLIYTNDGITGKLYVNCELKASGPSGSLIFTNTADLFFGKMNHPQYPYWFNGDLDEVRIYNRAVNTDEINVLGGCAPTTPVIINDYTAASAFDKCKNTLTVADASKYNAGDTVLLMQMKGAVIDSSNTVAFGTITDYKNAGNYEFNYIKTKTGNAIELKNVLTRQYDFADGKVQLIRVPFYQKLNTTVPLTCQQWDGTTGGVLAFNVADTLILNADIDVSGKGFRGGIDPVSSPALFYCYENQYYYPANPDLAAGKGEGIANISAARSFGKGASSNGGGGGNSHNAGGAGGGNSNTGGLGGYQYLNTPCNAPAPPDNRAISGNALLYSNAANKIFLGGGGGAGHTNNPEGFMALGGNGSGIIIISADKIKTNGRKIISNGNAGNACSLTATGCHEGMGGGGAGGTVLLKINSYLDNTAVETKGGKGADMTTAGLFKTGPGGGGGGGMVWLSNTAAPAAVAIANTGGANGVCTGYANDPSGATAGQNGSALFNLQLPVNNTPYKATFDSAKLNVEVSSCTNFKFLGLSDAVTSQIVKWQWLLGDGHIDSVQVFSHNYVSPGTYPVKLIATDIYGCVATFKIDLTVLCRCEEIKLTSANPTSDNITISGLGCGINTLVLYNMLGQKITQVSGDNASETIRMSNLPKGMYIVRIINKDKIVKHLKVEKR